MAPFDGAGALNGLQTTGGSFGLAGLMAPDYSFSQALAAQPAPAAASSTLASLTTDIMAFAASDFGSFFRTASSEPAVAHDQACACTGCCGAHAGHNHGYTPEALAQIAEEFGFDFSFNPIQSFGFTLTEDLASLFGGSDGGSRATLFGSGEEEALLDALAIEQGVLIQHGDHFHGDPALAAQLIDGYIGHDIIIEHDTVLYAGQDVIDDALLAGTVITDDEPSSLVAPQPIPLGLDDGEFDVVVIEGSLDGTPPAFAFGDFTFETEGFGGNDTVFTSDFTGLAMGDNGFGVFSGVIGNSPVGATDRDFFFLSAFEGDEITVLTSELLTTLPDDVVDPVVAVYLFNGGDLELVAASDNAGITDGPFGVTLSPTDALVQFEAPVTDFYIVEVHGSGAGLDLDPLSPDTVELPSSTGAYNLLVTTQPNDTDTFSFELEAGQVFGANVTGAPDRLELRGPDGTELTITEGDTALFNPSSPLTGGGNASLGFVVPEDGIYTIEVEPGGLGAEGEYELTTQVVDRESGSPRGSNQTIFIDLDGGAIDLTSFGLPPGTVAEFTGVADILEAAGFTEAEIDEAIDAIINLVELQVVEQIDALGINDNFSITITNSRDDVDNFGLTGVSRLVVGSSEDAFAAFGGGGLLGIADTIDVGNFDLEDQGLVFIDDLVGAALGTPVAEGSSVAELFGTLVGQVASHEAGHFLGNFHTFFANDTLNIQDTLFSTAEVVGLDGIFGTDDDNVGIFTADEFAPDEAFEGINDTAANLAIGGSVGSGEGLFFDTNTGVFFATAGDAAFVADVQPDGSIIVGDAAAPFLIGPGFGDVVDFQGGAFADFLGGGVGADLLVGLGGDDVIFGRGGNDTLNGAGGNDILAPGTGVDLVLGGPGFDIVSLEDIPVNVEVDLNTQTAAYVAGSGALIVDELSEIEGAIGSAFDDTLIGDGLGNLLVGGGGADALLGNGGDDFLAPGVGVDTVDGGEGFDTVVLNDIPFSVVIDIGAQTVAYVNGAGVEIVDPLISIEAGIGSAFDDTLIGSAGDDALAGDLGDDVIVGAAGDDIIITGLGDDLIDGGEGFDAVSFAIPDAPFADVAFSPAPDGVTVDLEASLASSELGTAFFENVEAVIGSIGDDVVTGSMGDDFVLGEAGDDLIALGGGSDFLDGGAGDDILAPGGGFDVIVGGLGVDTLDLFDIPAAVQVNLLLGEAAYVAPSGAEVVDLVFEVEQVSGTGFGDDLIGDAGANGLFGEGGSDFILGGGGDDALDGGDGGDVIFGGTGDDVIVGGNGIDNLNGGTGADFIQGGFGSDLVNGNAGDDFIEGNLGSDFLFGGTGSDIIAGGLGADVIGGGADADTFFAETAAELDGDLLQNVTDADTIFLSSEPGSVTTVNTVFDDDSATSGIVEIDLFSDGVIDATVSFTSADAVTTAFLDIDGAVLIGFFEDPSATSSVDLAELVDMDAVAAFLEDDFSVNDGVQEGGLAVDTAAIAAAGFDDLVDPGLWV